MAEALDINAVAHQFLADMKPEAMRTLLKRMDTSLRKAMLEPRNIPVTKVSLRAASQVLALARDEESPAESPLLGTMLTPAAELFHDAKIGALQITGMRLRSVDLALTLVAASEPVFRGLRTWHRWADRSFEDLALAMTIGLRCSHAALAAAYLSASHPEVAERYESLRSQFPNMPKIATGSLTETNPITRYLAANPNRKLPAHTAELRDLLSEDAKIRRAELLQATKERDRLHRLTAHRAGPRPNPAAELDEPQHAGTAGQEPDIPRSVEEESGQTGPLPPVPQLPSIAEWAKAVSSSRKLTEQLIAGQAPDIQTLDQLMSLTTTTKRWSALLSEALGETVQPVRSDMDRALTLILSDEKLHRRLAAIEAATGEAEQRTRSVPKAVPSGKPQASAPQNTNVTMTVPEAELDLSDMDALLRGSVGGALASVSGGEAVPARTTEQHAFEHQGIEPEEEDVPAEHLGEEAVPEETSADQAYDDQVHETLEAMAAAAWSVRTPQGPLTQAYVQELATIDLAELQNHRQSLVLACATALPVALTDPTGVALPLLQLDVAEMDDNELLGTLWHGVGELATKGITAQDAELIDLSHRIAELDEVKRSASELIETAATRKLKYDKATRVYRQWISPGGSLHALIDGIIRDISDSKLDSLLQDARKVGAGRAVDDTVAENFDAARTRIVAGARQALIDKYEEVLDLVQDCQRHRAGIAELERNGTIKWKYGELRKLGDKVSEFVHQDGTPRKPTGIKEPVLELLALRAASRLTGPLDRNESEPGFEQAVQALAEAKAPDEPQ